MIWGSLSLFLSLASKAEWQYMGYRFRWGDLKTHLPRSGRYTLLDKSEDRRGAEGHYSPALIHSQQAPECPRCDKMLGDVGLGIGNRPPDGHSMG